MKKIIYLVILLALFACGSPAETVMPEPLASPAPRLTPFPTSPVVNLFYIGEFTILDRTVTIRKDPAVTAKSVGTAYPGSVWVIDFPLYQDAAGNVWGKVASQVYWMALKYNGKYFSTWHE